MSPSRRKCWVCQFSWVKTRYAACPNCQPLLDRLSEIHEVEKHGPWAHRNLDHEQRILYYAERAARGLPLFGD